MKRKDSLKLAQKRYREKLAGQGACRLNFFISRVAYERIKLQALRSGLSLKEQIEALALGSTNSVGNMAKSFMDSGDASSLSIKHLQTLSREELIDFTIKQEFWLQRLQEVNNVLMNKK